MVKQLVLSSLTILALSLPISASAESCDASCPDGQKQVAFADGNDSACICADANVSMEETPELPEVGEPDDNDDGVPSGEVAS